MMALGKYYVWKVWTAVNILAGSLEVKGAFKIVAASIDAKS